MSFPLIKTETFNFLFRGVKYGGGVIHPLDKIMWDGYIKGSTPTDTVRWGCPV